MGGWAVDDPVIATERLLTPRMPRPLIVKTPPQRVYNR
jgi:hypothetical protein